MALTLHDALIPNWLQTLGAVAQLIGKAETACAEGAMTERGILDARLIEDMLPFAYQVKSCWVHSALALEGCKAGSFSPHMAPPPDSFDGLREMIGKAIETVSRCDAGELEAIAGNDMAFTIGDKLGMEFTVQHFLFGFSQPNLFFHAATAYDILRMKGLKIGKRDFLGALPLKG